jgi:hypothetical protein
MARAMASLKSLIPGLARALDMKPAALYERQRALVRAGLLEMNPGRGPGSGVPATSKTLAMLLISAVATSSLSETEEQTKLVANLKSASGRCPFTGKKTFAAALTEVLNSPPRMNSARWIDVERRGKAVTARIHFYGSPPKADLDGLPKLESSIFGASSTSKDRYNIEVRVTLFLGLAILEAAVAHDEEVNK